MFTVWTSKKTKTKLRNP